MLAGVTIDGLLWSAVNRKVSLRIAQQPKSIQPYAVVDWKLDEAAGNTVGTERSCLPDLH